VDHLDPGQNDTEFDRWTTAWYMHVTRVEMIHPGRPPFTAQPPASESPSSSPT
jgi:hypothetical protein